MYTTICTMITRITIHTMIIRTTIHTIIRTTIHTITRTIGTIQSDSVMKRCEVLTANSH